MSGGRRRREQVFSGWGEPGAGPTLSARAAGVLRERLGVSGSVVAPPVALEDVRLRAPVVADSLRAALVRAVGEPFVRDDRAARVLRAAGKSYLDLLALRAGAAEDAPDVVVAPGDARAGSGGAARLHGGGSRGDPVRRRDQRGGRCGAAARTLGHRRVARSRPPGRGARGG